MHRPDKRVLETLRHWLLHPEPMLGGRAKRFLDDEGDLVALKSATERDYLSQFLRRHWPVKVSHVSYLPTLHHYNTI